MENKPWLATATNYMCSPSFQMFASFGSLTIICVSVCTDRKKFVYRCDSAEKNCVSADVVDTRYLKVCARAR